MSAGFSRTSTPTPGSHRREKAHEGLCHDRGSKRKDGENIVVTIEDEERARVPLHMLASVVTFGTIYLSPPLMQACAVAGITIVLLDRVGRFQARIEGP